MQVQKQCLSIYSSRPNFDSRVVDRPQARGSDNETASAPDSSSSSGSHAS